MYVNMNIRENFSIIGELGDILFWFKCLFIINYWLQLVVSCFYLNTTVSELLRNEWNKVISHFGFEGGTLVLIASSVLGHCLNLAFGMLVEQVVFVE